MPVAVQGASRRQDDDPLAKIAKGLSIAQSVFGIKSAMEQSDLRDLQQQRILAEQEREQTGAVTPSQLREQYTTKRPEGSALVPQTVQVQRDSGIETVENVFSQASIERESKARQAKLAADIASTNKKVKDKQDTFARGKTLRDEYRKSSDDTFEAMRGLKKVESAATNPNPSGATDVALVFGFMKTIDPGSVVRESEFATAENTAGVPEKIRIQYNKALEGQRLAPAQRANFLTEARRQALGQLDFQTDVDERFASLSGEHEVPVNLVVDPTFATAREILQQQLNVNIGQGISSTGLPGESSATAEETDANFLQRYINEFSPKKPQGLQIPGQPRNPLIGR